MPPSINNNAPEADTVQAINKRTFDDIITTWVNAASPGSEEGRNIAAERIKDVYDRNARELNLRYLALTCLPDVLPPGVELLDISGNQLSKLPANLPSDLDWLDASNNQLTRLPAKLPKKLSNLLASHNCLTRLPDSLPEQLKLIDVEDNLLTTLKTRLPATLELLKISHNQLSQLPAQLPEYLQQLIADRNHLTSLPATLPRSLKTLSVGHNQLTILPANLPPSLKWFYANSNALQSLPAALPADLEMLFVQNNQLRDIPDNLPRGLRFLYIADNQLTSLAPISSHLVHPAYRSLWQLPDTCTVYIENNRFSEAVLAQLHTTVNASEYSGPTIMFSMATTEDKTHKARPLSDTVAAWYALTKIGEESAETLKTVWTDIEKETSANDFSVFLDRLQRTVNSTEPAFRRAVLTWLTHLANDADLRKEIFLEAKEALGSCEDRLSLSLNAMKQRELMLNVMRGYYDNHLEKLIPLARQQYRLNELAKIAYEKVQTLRFVDEIEVYLAYQVQLREALALAIDTHNMRFFGVAHVSQNDLEVARLRVQENENKYFFSYLANEWSPWQSVLQRLVPQDYAMLQDEIYNEKMDQLEETQNALLNERGQEDTEPNRLAVTSEALQIISMPFNQVFTKKFLQRHENKLGQTLNLTRLLGPIWPNN